MTPAAVATAHVVRAAQRSAPAVERRADSKGAAAAATFWGAAIGQGGSFCLTGHGVVYGVTGVCTGTGAIAVGLTTLGVVVVPSVLAWHAVRWLQDREGR